MKTRITELLGIKHPIMSSSMTWVTEPKLVSAVSNAGGLGILSLGSLTPEEVRKQVREVRELTDKPFGIGQALRGPKAAETLGVAIEEKVPVINYAMGVPWFCEQVHEYGGKVIGTVLQVRHAVRAEQAGVDALNVTGYESAGHGLLATTLVLLPMVASACKVPLLAAGGIFDGRGLAAALVLGADGITMGTRFMMTKDSALHENAKQVILKASEQDTIYSDRWDGSPARALKAKGTEDLLRRNAFPLIGAITGALQVKKLLDLSWWDLITSAVTMSKGENGQNIFQQLRFAGGAIAHRRVVDKGDTDVGFIYAGQTIGGIHDVPSVAEVTERIVAEAEEALARGMGTIRA